MIRPLPSSTLFPYTTLFRSRARVEGTLHALATGDVGQPERLGRGVDAGVTLEAGAANVGEQPDVRRENHAEPLIARGPTGRLVVGVHRSREQDGNGVSELAQRDGPLAARGFGHRLQRPGGGRAAVPVAEEPPVPLDPSAEDRDRLLGPPGAQERDAVAEVIAEVRGIRFARRERGLGSLVDGERLGPAALPDQRVAELAA